VGFLFIDSEGIHRGGLAVDRFPAKEGDFARRLRLRDHARQSWTVGDECDVAIGAPLCFVFGKRVLLHASLNLDLAFGRVDVVDELAGIHQVGIAGGAVGSPGVHAGTGGRGFHIVLKANGGARGRQGRQLTVGLGRVVHRLVQDGGLRGSVGSRSGGQLSRWRRQQSAPGLEHVDLLGRMSAGQKLSQAVHDGSAQLFSQHNLFEVGGHGLVGLVGLFIGLEQLPELLHG